MVLYNLYRIIVCCVVVLGVIAHRASAIYPDDNNYTDYNTTGTTIRNFHCITYNYDEFLNCTWDINDRLLSNVEYRLKWRVVFPYHNSNWIYSVPTTTNKFGLNLSDGDVDPERTIDICISVGNESENCHKNINIAQIVRPAPVSNVSISYPCPTCISVTWDHNRNDKAMWPGQLYRIQFKSKWETLIEKNVTYRRINVTGLTSYTVYQINISCIPLNGGFWSGAIIRTARTQKDVPSKPPTTTIGSFSVQRDVTNHDSVIIYWKRLEEQYKCDRQITYRVLYYSKESNYTEQKDLNDTTAVFPYISNNSYVVRIWSVNTIGISRNSSSILVPKQNNLLNPPSSVAFLSKGNPEVKIKWDYNRSLHIPKITSVTVYWCYRKSFIHCQDNLYWKIISPIRKLLETKLIINATSFIFGASIQQSNSTSAIKWSNCIVQDNVIPFQPIVMFKPTKDTLVFITWKMVECNNNLLFHVFRKFKVHICANGNCQEIEVSGKNTSISHAVDHGSMLCVMVAPVTEAGQGHWSDKSCFKQKVDTDAVNITLYIAISIGISALVFIALVIWKCIKYNKSVEEETKIDTSSFITASFELRTRTPLMVDKTTN